MPKRSFHPACNWLTHHFSLTVLLRATLAVAAIISATAVSAAAATHYVDPAGICGGNSPCYTNIQAAVNAASPTDTIIVGPGTYTENVTLAKSLTIQGAQAGVGACGCRATESIVTAASGILLDLQTGSVGSVIDGLTFSGAARGIESTSGPINNLQILNNRFIGFTGSGIFLNDSGTDITVNQNSLDGSSQVGSGDVFHLDTDNFDGFHLTNNCISNGIATGFFVDGNHNVGESGTRDPLISGNVINNNNTGMNLGSRAFGENGTPATGIYGGTISNNTFRNNNFDGLQGGIQHVLVSGNTFSDNGRSGLALTSFGNAAADRGAQNSLISCNNFTGNGFTNAGSGISFSSTQAPNTISTNQAELNNIVGNNIGATYNGAETIDATNNWWGSATGPTIASNPGGTGDSIVNPSGGLDYTPFLTSVASCTTLTTSPGNQQGWLAAGSAAGGLVQFVSGPAVPPLGSGSLRIFTGTQGDAAREFRNSNYNGTSLSALTGLGYCTYVTSWNGGQVPYLILRVDRDNDGDIDDLLFFEPLYSDGSYNPAIPTQPTPVLNTWQCWNALKGGWYGLDATTFAASFGGPGAGVLPFTDYTTAFPTAVLRNAPTGVTGAIRLLSGFASPTDVFDSNSDAFKVGVGSNLITFDFEPSQPTAINKTAGDNQGTLVSTPFPINLQVTVTNELAAGVPNIPVTFTAPTSGASGTFAGGCTTVTVITDSSGVATAPQFTANAQAGYYTVTATAPNLPTANFALRNMLSPTAADATISGRILANDGTAIAGATVNLAGTQTRKTISDASGNYRFDNVETSGFYTVTPWRANYSFGPASRSFSQLGNTTEAAFTGTPNSVIVGNSIDTPEYFVRQHYLDFLGREPDEAGFNFWSDQMLECGADAGCLERRRINVSAAYFLSIEFQQTGGLVDGLYKASYGVRPQFAEFMPDARSIAENVVVGRTGWEEQLRINKEAFVASFVQRAEFRSAFDSLSNENYVDRLIAHTGVAFTESERDALVSDLAGSRLTRAAVLLRIAADDRFVTAKRNEAFVMMEYFGYLRRDPDDSGYQFWLNKLNQFGGNFEQAEMVKAFIVSGEYRDRFPR